MQETPPRVLLRQSFPLSGDLLFTFRANPAGPLIGVDSECPGEEGAHPSSRLNANACSLAIVPTC
jgi:hypothetical protein